MDEQKLAEQRPENIEQALDDMHRTLKYYHATKDKRAVFLRLYYVMTLEVYKAIHGCEEYQGIRTFLDPDWIFHLSGRFATRYFASLDPNHPSPAWTAAHEDFFLGLYERTSGERRQLLRDGEQRRRGRVV